jgi:glycosyltransferase involved in cell wall biosynthesis
LRLLARDLPAHGWPTEVLVPTEGPLVDAVRRDGTTTTVLRPPDALLHYGRVTKGIRSAGFLLALPRYWNATRRAVKAGNAAIVHIDDHRGMLLTAIGGRLGGARVVWHHHSVQQSAALNRLCSMLADVVVVPSAAVLSRVEGLSPRKEVVVVANCVAIGDEPERVEPPVPTLVTMARLHPDKAVDIQLRVLARLRERYPDIRLVVLGEPQLGYEAYAEELYELGRALGVDTAVDWVGQVDDPRPYLERATLYWQPSRDKTELLPLAVLEAMERALPVVASDVGGMREIVVDGETGVLLAAGDEDGLVRVVGELIDDPARRADMGRKGRALASSQFSEGVLAARVSELYERLLDK